MDIQEIKSLNRRAGYHFFDRESMKFFDSRVLSRVFEGKGGVYFITSEMFHGSMSDGPRKYTVRQFMLDGSVNTCGEFNALDKYAACKLASKLSLAL